MGRTISYLVFKKNMEHSNELCLKLEKYHKQIVCEICPKCALFSTQSPYYGNEYELNPLIIRSFEQHHSYSNLYWESKHYRVISNIGRASTMFGYSDIREIDAYEVENKIKQLEELEHLGDPLHYEETYGILIFLKNWCTDDNMVLIFDED